MLSDMHPLFDDRIYWKECISLKKFGYKVIHLGVGESNIDKISEHGIRLICIQRKTYSKNLYLDIIIRNVFFRKQLNKKLFKIASQLKADYYNIHDLKLTIFMKRLKNLPHKPMIIYSIHESYPDKIRDYNRESRLINLFKPFYAKYIEWWEMKNSCYSDFIITFDNALYKKFSAIYNKEKVKIIFNYTNLFPKKRTQTKKLYDLIYIGGLSEQRGIINILMAVSKCKIELPEIKLLLLGKVCNNDFNNKIIRTIHEYNLTTNIEFKNWVPYSEVENYLSKSKVGMVILLPIPKFFKNIPIKQFEYMAFGLPVIGSDLPPITQFVKPVNAGILVDPTNIQNISDAIIRLLTDIDTYNKMSKNALKAAKEKYNWKFEEKKYLKLFES